MISAKKARQKIGSGTSELSRGFEAHSPIPDYFTVPLHSMRLFKSYTILKKSRLESNAVQY